MVREHGRDLRRRGGAAGVLLLQDLQGSLLEERQADRHAPQGERLVDRAVGQLEGVRGAVVAIEALHRHARQPLERGRVRARLQVGTARAGRGVAVLDQRDLLAARVRGHEADLDAVAVVGAVDAAHEPAADVHRQQRGLGRVRLVLGVALDQLQPGVRRLLTPVAALAGLGARHHSARLDRALDGLVDAVRQDREQLPRALQLALQVAERAVAHVAVHAQQPRVRPLVEGARLGRHHVTRAAELPALHAVHDAQRHLRPALAGRLTRAPDSGRPQTGRSSPRQARRRAAGPVAAPLCGFQAGQKRGLNFLARPLAATKYLTQLHCQTQRTHGERIYPSPGVPNLFPIPDVRTGW